MRLEPNQHRNGCGLEDRLREAATLSCQPATGRLNDEYFVDILGPEVTAPMKVGIDGLAAYGFDWVEFDNMDWAFDDQNRVKYWFSATVEDSIAFYRGLCTHAHSEGVRCVAKSTVEGAEIFDGVTYESYPDDMNWWDEDRGRRFLKSGKPMIIIHCGESICAATQAQNVKIFGNSLSFLCKSRSANGYQRLIRSARPLGKLFISSGFRLQSSIHDPRRNDDRLTALRPSEGSLSRADCYRSPGCQVLFEPVEQTG